MGSTTMELYSGRDNGWVIYKTWRNLPYPITTPGCLEVTMRFNGYTEKVYSSCKVEYKRLDWHVAFSILCSTKFVIVLMVLCDSKWQAQGH